MALPTSTPHFVLSIASRSSPHSPASRSARLPATTAYWCTLSILRISFVVKSSPASRFKMGAPMRVGRSSNTPGFHSVRSIAPDVPAHRDSKNNSRSLPAVDTTPAPVITTRCSSGRSRTEEAARTTQEPRLAREAGRAVRADTPNRSVRASLEAGPRAWCGANRGADTATAAEAWTATIVRGRCALRGGELWRARSESPARSVTCQLDFSEACHPNPEAASARRNDVSENRSARPEG
jgi:hypothetical protein